MIAGAEIRAPDKGQLPLARWLGRSYLRAAIIPLLLIEFSFVLIYWVSSNFIYQRNVEAVSSVSQEYLTDIAVREADTIHATVDGIEGLGKIYALETREALRKPYDPPAAEKARYGMTRSGVFYTRSGGDESASFYSGMVPVGQEQIEKVWRTAQLDGLMKHIKATSPLIRQVYLNTWDSYNRIYPYFDVLEQYAPKMNIPSYNFYYEADAKHNPARKVVWTDSYVDPAGSGWMVSAIAPVYGSERLEAVVGIDLTIDTIVKHVLALDLPWNGYAMLVGRDGTILAIPPAGERFLGLRSLEDQRHGGVVREDTFKPGQFNVANRPDLKPLAEALTSRSRGMTRITVADHEMFAATARIPGPDWHLVVMAPAREILADANNLHGQLRQVGLGMLVILLIFYTGFFMFLTYRARAMSRRVAEPLKTIETMMERIGAGEYEQQAPKFGVTELDVVSDRLAEMGGKLSQAYNKVLEKESELRSALESEKRVTSGQRRFINILNHEFRTPLTVIDSCGQILRRRAARLTEEMAMERSEMIRRSAQRISDVMKSALQLVKLEEGEISRNLANISADGLIREAINMSAEVRPDVSVVASMGGSEAMIRVDPTMIRTALAAIIENGRKYSREGTTVKIDTEYTDQACRIVVRDEGVGIPADELPHVCERFFRGANSTNVPGAGTGLYLASTLIEAHSGTMSIESVLGEGTTVTVTLPCLTPSAARLQEAA